LMHVREDESSITQRFVGPPAETGLSRFHTQAGPRRMESKTTGEALSGWAVEISPNSSARNESLDHATPRAVHGIVC